MPRTLPRLLPVLFVLGLAACETVEGAGQDLSAGGQAVSEAARETQAEM